MDDPGGSTPIVWAILCLCLSFVFSGLESVLYSSDLVKLKSAFQGHKGVLLALRQKENPKPILSSLLLGNTLVNITFASLVTAVALSKLALRRDLVEGIATVCGTIVVLIFGEITPKLIGTANPEPILVRVSPLLSAFSVVMRPFSFVAERAASLVAKTLPRIPSMADTLDEARLMATVDYGESSGAIRNDEKEMIHGVIDIRDLDVTEVMVPRPDMIVLEENRSALDALNLLLRYGLSRIPLYLDSKDNITGIVSIKDLVVYVGDSGTCEQAPQTGTTWQETLRGRSAKEFAVPPHFVPETKNARSLLQEMMRTGTQMAIVIDEFDGVSGLVTLEDLVEQIVGEIRDEYDVREIEPVLTPGGAWQAPGRMSLADLENRTGIDIEDEDVDTIAGLVMKILDRVPVPGDEVYLDEPPLRILVMDVKGPRIRRVLIERREPAIRNRALTQGEVSR